MGKPASGRVKAGHPNEYTNTLAWFYDRYDHPHRLKLLYVAGSFLCQTSHWLRSTPGNGLGQTNPPREAAELSGRQMLGRLDDAMVRRNPDESVAWVKAYLAGGHSRDQLIRTLALGAAKQGNDTHNQEIGLCFLEDYLRSTSRQRELLLMASAHHTPRATSSMGTRSSRSGASPRPSISTRIRTRRVTPTRARRCWTTFRAEWRGRPHPPGQQTVVV